MSSSHIALAGATGNLGVPILQALLDAGYKVTALSRNGGNSSRLKPHPNLVVKQVDFTSADSISPALQDVDVVVSCLATLAIGSQTPLIDAAFGAGVKRFIPAEFGMDSRNPLCKELPVCVPKAAVQQYLREKHKLRPSFTWTGIANGMFLDWCLREGLVLNPAKHSAILYNGGDVPFSATTLADVATAVLGIIRHQSETENRLVYIHSAMVSQSKLINMAVEIDGKAWQTTLKDTEDLKRESLAELAKGADADVEAAMLGFCFCGMMHPGYGCDFSDHLDNDLLGVKGLSDGELRAVMAGLL